MIEIVPFKAEHLELFNGKMSEEWVPAFMDVDDLAVEYARRGLLYSMFVDGRVEVIAGIVRLWAGVAEAVAIVSPTGRRHMRAVHRMAKKVLGIAIGNGFWRIQTNVLEGFDKGKTWVERLGFHDEGIMERYTPDGRNMIRYAMVRKEGP